MKIIYILQKNPTSWYLNNLNIQFEYNEDEKKLSLISDDVFVIDTSELEIVSTEVFMDD